MWLCHLFAEENVNMEDEQGNWNQTQVLPIGESESGVSRHADDLKGLKADLRVPWHNILRRWRPEKKSCSLGWKRFQDHPTLALDRIDPHSDRLSINGGN